MTQKDRASGWFVYIVSCSDDSLYTGITTDLERRTLEHNTGKGAAKYTRARRPVRLVYWERAESRSGAARREYQIKRLSPAEKRQLINQQDSRGTTFKRQGPNNTSRTKPPVFLQFLLEPLDP